IEGICATVLGDRHELGGEAVAADRGVEGWGPHRGEDHVRAEVPRGAEEGIDALPVALAPDLVAVVVREAISMEPVRVRDRQLGEFLAVHFEWHGEGREVLAAVRLDLEGDVARLNGADRAEADPRRAPLPGYGAQFARVRVGVEG